MRFAIHIGERHCREGGHLRPASGFSYASESTEALDSGSSCSVCVQLIQGPNLQLNAWAGSLRSVCAPVDPGPQSLTKGLSWLVVFSLCASWSWAPISNWRFELARCVQFVRQLIQGPNLQLNAWAGSLCSTCAPIHPESPISYSRFEFVCCVQFVRQLIQGPNLQLKVWAGSLCSVCAKLIQGPNLQLNASAARCVQFMRQLILGPNLQLKVWAGSVCSVCAQLIQGPNLQPKDWAGSLCSVCAPVDPEPQSPTKGFVRQLILGPNLQLKAWAGSVCSVCAPVDPGPQSPTKGLSWLVVFSLCAVDPGPQSLTKGLYWFVVFNLCASWSRVPISYSRLEFVCCVQFVRQ